MNSLLTRPVRYILSTRAGSPGSSRRIYLTGILLCSVANTCTAQAYESIDEYKLYAHSRIVNYKQFQCFNQLITHESHWDVNARNGSHYGLGQMKNDKYRNLDAYRMIDWSIRYYKNRYGSHCNAYRFYLKNHYS